MEIDRRSYTVANHVIWVAWKILFISHLPHGVQVLCRDVMSISTLYSNEMMSTNCSTIAAIYEVF